MNYKSNTVMVFVALNLTLGSGMAQTKDGERIVNKSSTAKTKSMTNKEKGVALLKSIETGAIEPIEYINPNKYIQHNLAVADGLVGFKAFLKALPPNAVKVNTVRAFEDGDFAFTHTTYDFFGPKTSFDVFRFEDGLIVEHWNNMQKTAQPNPSGHTMIDGPIMSADLNKTAENKILVKHFVEDILVSGKMDKLTKYFNGDNYIQHNPFIPDQVSGLSKAFGELAKQGITMKYNKIHKILGEGNFVLVMSEGYLSDKHNSFYDLFRVENGKIAEHWDTIEPIPMQAEWKNSNGKF